MIHNIRDAFNELLETNKWMDDDTKSVAKEKVSYYVYCFWYISIYVGYLIYRFLFYIFDIVLY